MTRMDMIETEATRLRAEAQPYAVATVVRTLAATSAKPGARALILGDGSIIAGWIGGPCARGAVVRAATAAIASGRPQFVSLRPEEVLRDQGVEPGQERDGIRFARNGCPSQGSMDIFVEPVLPRPHLVILGAGPVALALCDLAARFDLHRTLAAPGLADPTLADNVQDSFDLPPGAGPPRYVVVATQGRGDEAALRASLAAGAAQVAFVGSRRKFATLSARLAGEGVDTGLLAAVAAPAGLDIHAITPEEIALSILAQVVGWRRADDRPAPAP
ncbi:MAG: XdhC family protein [Gemmobacter sp.]